MSGKSPRVLFVADLNIYSKGYCRARVLDNLALSAKLLTHTAIGGEAKGHPDFSLSYRVAHKFGHTLDTEGINTAILAEAAARAPDLIWIEKGNMIRPETLKKLRILAPDAKIASYSEDDMALAHNRSHAFTRGLPLYDCILTTKVANVRSHEMIDLGARRVVLMDKAYDPFQHTPQDVSDDDVQALGSDVGFVGTFEAERAESLLFLAKNGINVRVWGNGWGAWQGRHPQLQVEAQAVVNTAENLAYTRTICATKINLGFLRKLNRDTQTDRTMEIPACGAFMLAERSADHERLFNAGEEADFFSSPEEMLDKVRGYLADDSRRQAIAKAGHKRARESGYGEDQRLQIMIEKALDQAL